jgi:branched-chain amino acid transport system ATP-binding protein
MLEAENVHAYYGLSHVLQGVSFRVDEGEIVSLLGRNGAGKTTALMTVMGFLRPDPGTIRYRGRTISGLAPHQISHLGLGFVPQERGIFASLTTRENLTVAARSGERSRWSLGEIYALFPRLKERERNFGHQLSGGEQQMLAIARALMLNPAILVLDEPSEGLAPKIIEEIIEILRQLRRDGMACLLVEQNLRVALALADRHHVFSKGQVRFVGTSAELEANEEVKHVYLAV